MLCTLCVEYSVMSLLSMTFKCLHERYRIISNVHGTLFSWISQGSWLSQKYILMSILNNIYNQAAIHEIKNAKYPSSHKN